MRHNENSLSWFSSPWVNEDSDLVKCHAHASIWRVAEGASGVSVLKLRSLTVVSFGEEAQVRGLCFSVW